MFQMKFYLDQSQEFQPKRVNIFAKFLIFREKQFISPKVRFFRIFCYIFYSLETLDQTYITENRTKTKVSSN